MKLQIELPVNIVNKILIDIHALKDKFKGVPMAMRTDEQNTILGMTDEEVVKSCIMELMNSWASEKK